MGKIMYLYNSLKIRKIRVIRGFFSIQDEISGVIDRDAGDHQLLWSVA